MQARAAAADKVPAVVARPRAARGAPGVGDGVALEPVYVWDLVVRLSHWVIVLSMMLLIATGIAIGRPFLATSSTGFTHGWVRVIHFYSAMAFSLAVAARLIWMVTGPRHSGWRQFIPSSRRRLKGLWGTLLFYMALRPRPPDAVGHNPMAGLAYLAVFFMYALMIASGFAMYSASAYTSYMSMWDFLVPLFGGLQTARWIHHVTMWLLICFIIQHLFSAVLTAKAEKNGTMDSMFSGYKFVPVDRVKDDDEDEEAHARAKARARKATRDRR
jgi:Ni/Fe-hydrogenase 1 B-type cytochrome subunit